MYPRQKSRVRVLVLNNKDEVLLTRSWFGFQRWSLPGGGIRRREFPLAAAMREVHEETGVVLQLHRLKSLGKFENGDSAAPFIVDCYVARIDKQPARIPARYRLEMLDVAWFPLRDIPKDHSPTIDEAMKLYGL